MATDPTINSLLPIHQIGQDGGGFWIGQVEEIDEPKQSNRFRVRIVSVHSSDGEEVKTEDLPWAHSALPVNMPAKIPIHIGMLLLVEFASISAICRRLT